MLFHSLKVNTLRAEFMSQGMNHFEGGWPKDINPAEHDQTMRFRKKIEKDDSYINSVLGLCQVRLGWPRVEIWVQEGVKMHYRMFFCSA